MSKLKINVNQLPPLLCIVVSAAQNGEFERSVGGFALTFTTRYKKEKRVENSFSTAPQKLESPGFQIEHQIN